MLSLLAEGPCGRAFIDTYKCIHENRDEDECVRLITEMKACWAKYPDRYEKIVKKVYEDGKQSDENAAKADPKSESINGGVADRIEKNDTVSKEQDR